MALSRKLCLHRAPAAIRHALAIAACSAAWTLPMPAQADEPKVSRQGDYSYVSGGLSDDEQRQFEQLAPRYLIQLVFKRNGDKADVSGVKVRIRNTAGDLVLETATLGPYLYVNPPSGGRFTIEAEFMQQTQAKTRDLVGRRYLHLEFDFAADGEAR